MISFPWDNTSSTVLDRNVSSDIFAEAYIDALSGYNSGINAPVGSQGSISAGSGMTVIAQPVAGVIKGRIFNEPNARTLTVQASEELDRIDTVVLRRDKANRLVDWYIVKGTAASSPVRPTLTRSGDIYECGVADLFIPQLSTATANERITDTRSETARINIVPVVGSVDTTTFYAQYQASLDAFMALVAAAIDETMAGYLQNQITALSATISSLDASTIDYDNTTSGLTATKVQGAIDEVNQSLNANIAGTAITLNTTLYTTESDGYLVLTSFSSGGYVNIGVYDANSVSIGIHKCHYAGDGNDYKFLYIKKGMKLKIEISNGTYSAKFTPLG